MDVLPHYMNLRFELTAFHASVVLLFRHIVRPVQNYIYPAYSRTINSHQADS